MAMLKYSNARSPQKDDGKSGKEGSVQEEASETPAEAKSEGDAPESASTKKTAERMSVFKRHETARRDMHANERDMRRKLDMAHEKELAEMMKRHEDEMAQQQAAGSPPAAAAPPAAALAEGEA